MNRGKFGLKMGLRRILSPQPPNKIIQDRGPDPEIPPIPLRKSAGSHC